MQASGNWRILKWMLLMKVGDLVKIDSILTQQRVGIIVHMDSLSHGMLSLPRVLSGGKVLLLGRGVCEVISERG
jgi:hypothetical protein